MKHSSKLFITAVALWSIWSVHTMRADFLVAESEREFYRYLDRYALSVVHFNPFEQDLEDEALDRTKNAFATLGERERYDDADVAFIGVNLHKVPELADDFNLAISNIGIDHKKDLEDEEETDVQEIKTAIADLKPEEQSVIMLFKNGNPLKENDKMVQRTGFIRKAELADFVEEYFADAIDKVLKKMRDTERERERVRVVRPQQVVTTRYVERPVTRYVYPSYDYGYYPHRRRYWGGYGGYYRRPGFGIGIGFGRRWGRFGGGPYGIGGGFGIGFGW